jgi:hypothetical protein
MAYKENQELNRSINDLSLTEDCKFYLIRENIFSLNDFISAGWAGQKKSDNFNVQYFNEVIRFLDNAGLLHLMEGL